MSVSTKIFKNAMSNWFGMGINTIILLLITPYLLDNLGDERYGIYQIVAPIVQYLVLLEVGLRGAIARFASGYITSGEKRKLNQVISTTFFICCLMSVLVFAICTFLGKILPHYIPVPLGQEQQVLYMFWGTGFMLVMSFMGYSFGGVLMGHHRFELLNIQLIVANGGRALLILLFFSNGWISLGSWAFAMAISSFAGVLCLIIMAFYLQRSLSIRPKHVNLSILKELVGFGSWNMLRQVSHFFLYSFNPIIIGKFIGVASVPYYGIPFMIIRRLESVVMGLASTLIPVASKNLSREDKPLMQRLIIKGTYVSSMIVFPIGLVLVVMCKDLFRVWLSPEYAKSWQIYAILMISFVGVISQSCIAQILLGGGKIRAVAIIQASSSVAVLFLGVIFVGYLKMGLLGAAYAVTLPKMLDNILIPYYACKQFDMKLGDFLIKSYARPLLSVVPSICLGLLLTHYWPAKNLLWWIAQYFMALFPYGIMATTPFLDWPLRERIIKIFLNRIVMRRQA